MSLAYYLFKALFSRGSPSPNAPSIPSIPTNPANPTYDGIEDNNKYEGLKVPEKKPTYEKEKKADDESITQSLSPTYQARKAAEAGFSAASETAQKISGDVTNSINMAVGGVLYNVSKSIDALGETVITITKQVGDSVTTIFKDTERNAFMFLGNTMQNISNAYIDTEQNILHGIRSPIEKGIHMIDDQLDQLQVLIYDNLHNMNSGFQMVAILVFIIILLAFLFLAKKEYIMKILNMIQTFNLKQFI